MEAKENEDDTRGSSPTRQTDVILEAQDELNDQKEDHGKLQADTAITEEEEAALREGFLFGYDGAFTV